MRSSLLLLTFASFFGAGSQNLFGSDNEGFLAALGDFNNDKYVDIAVVNNAASDGSISLSILYFVGGQETPSVKRGSHNLVIGTSVKVYSVIPGDFNGDSALDILVVYGNSDTNMNFGVFWHSLQSPSAFETFMAVDNMTLQGQPLVLDYNGDQIPDLLAMVDGTAKFVTTFGTKSFRDLDFTAAASSQEAPKTMIADFAHAFAHVTDNPQPDMVLGVDDGGTAKLQVWSAQRPEGGYYSKDLIQFPQHQVLGNPTVVDIDLNGEPDIVLPVCEDSDCNKSKIYYTSLGSDTQTWHLMHSFGDSSTSNKDDPLKKFKKTSAFPGIKNNIFLRSADVNFDGYPDFLVTLEDENGATGLYYLMNWMCQPGNDDICDGPRGLSVSASMQPNAEVGTFFDFRENGNNDIIYSYHDDGKFLLGSREISDKGDDAFLKVYVIGGLCGSMGAACHFNHHNFGANLPGPTLSYSTTGNKGDNRKSVATQLSQASHYALQPPFVIFGLGQTPNFVEYLTITLASTEKRVGKITIPNVIPNSQLILIPHPPGDPSNWNYQLLLTPSDILWKFATALGGLMILLAALIGILQYQEKREDDREKRQEAHKFHFDAM